MNDATRTETSGPAAHGSTIDIVADAVTNGRILGSLYRVREQELGWF